MVLGGVFSLIPTELSSVYGLVVVSEKKGVFLPLLRSVSESLSSLSIISFLSNILKMGTTFTTHGPLAVVQDNSVRSAHRRLTGQDFSQIRNRLRLVRSLRDLYWEKTTNLDARYGPGPVIGFYHHVYSYPDDYAQGMMDSYHGLLHLAAQVIACCTYSLWDNYHSSIGYGRG